LYGSDFYQYLDYAADVCGSRYGIAVFPDKAGTKGARKGTGVAVVYSAFVCVHSVDADPVLCSGTQCRNLYRRIFPMLPPI
ncbi:MAG: hypothetical protein MJ014_00970, partial [Methanocorpusculum sp.]|nr:hypothetical protein [Methanocorpusculum sp.]